MLACQELIITHHARERMQQRSITRDEVSAAVRYGERSWSHGAHAYVLTDRALRRSPLATLADRLRGLCVIVHENGAVSTVKWLHRIRHAAGVMRGALVKLTRDRHAGVKDHERPVENWNSGVR